MPKPSEWTIEDLRTHLMAATEVELTTIPPYLTALYSIEPGANKKAAEVIHSVVMEEMLHLALAANVLNAVGGFPDLPTNAPVYPVAFPFHGPQPFEVGVGPLSDEALDTFLLIENPSHPPKTVRLATSAASKPRVLLLAEENGYETIGDFYSAVEEGLRALDSKGKIFTGDPKRQVPKEFYGGPGQGGEIIEVSDLKTALAALEQIVEQGEGDVTKPPPGDKFDPEGELAHFYRFQELRLGREYEPEDMPGEPTGPAIEMDFGKVFPMRRNLKVAELSEPLKKRAEEVNAVYSMVVNQVQKGINGQPTALGEAIGLMIKLKGGAPRLLKEKLPGGSGENSGPTFEYH
jgi:Ferritin-like